MQEGTKATSVPSPKPALPGLVEVKARSSYCTMHRALMAGGYNSGTAGLKKMMKLSNNGKYI